MTQRFPASVARRAARLQAEYLAAESQLLRHRVKHGILVMGSTRASERHPCYRMARQFGRLVAMDGRAALMTGGGPGIMEAASRGAYEAGGISIGLNIQLPRRQIPNRFLSLSLGFRYFALRKLHFLLRARAMVAFPGGYGTLDELFETLMLVQCQKMRPMPIVLVGTAYWRRAIDFGFLERQDMIVAADRRLFTLADSAAAAWSAVLPALAKKRGSAAPSRSRPAARPPRSPAPGR